MGSHWFRQKQKTPGSALLGGISKRGRRQGSGNPVYGLLKRTTRKAGLAPGTLLHTGDPSAEAPHLHCYRYNKDSFEESTPSPDEAVAAGTAAANVWLEVQGLQDIALIESLGERFNLHPLLLEDVLHTQQRPKVDPYDGHLFLTMRAFAQEEPTAAIRAEQISLVFDQHTLISFTEGEGACLNSVRERLRKAKGRVRQHGPDYLAYALVDTVVGSYFVLLDSWGQNLERLEERIESDPDVECLQEIHRRKRELMFVRRSVWPLREAVRSLDRFESVFIHKSLHPYLRDLRDHLDQVIEILDTYREMLSSVLESYVSMAGLRMNETMKVLTTIATFFIPLTFIAGVYGMNFKSMPELSWPYGYPLALGLMLVVGSSMLFYFRTRKWL